MPFSLAGLYAPNHNGYAGGISHCSDMGVTAHWLDDNNCGIHLSDW